MEKSNNKSGKVFSIVYAVLAILSAFLMFQLVLTHQAFVDFRGSLLFVLAAATCIVTSIAVWVKWNDNFPYSYEVPYKISRFARFKQVLFASYVISSGLYMVLVIIGFNVFGFDVMAVILSKYTVVFIIISTAVFFPFVRKHMKIIS